jgi:superfamily II DNA/RNA helicase
MGFIPDLEKIGSLLPKMRQTLMFSATMPKGVRKFADQFLSNPKEIIVSTQSSAADNVDHYLVNTHPKDKLKTLRRLLDELNVDRALIFCNRKRDIGSVRRSLGHTDYTSLSLHGDLSQKKRSETLEKMHAGEVDILVASDVAARGLDIDGLNFVFNYDVPNNADSYVHRIGRTGRASEKGMAITLATNKDKKYLQAVEELIGEEIPELSKTKDVIKDTNQKKSSDKKTGRQSEKKSNKRSAQEKSQTKKPDKKPTGKKNGRQSESVIELDQPDRRTTDDGRIIGFGGKAPSFMLKEFKKIG